MQELSSLFMTHRLIVMYAPVELWPGHESGTDRRTDGRTGRTGVTLNALPLFFEKAGA